MKKIKPIIYILGVIAIGLTIHKAIQQEQQPLPFKIEEMKGELIFVDTIPMDDTLNANKLNAKGIKRNAEN